MESRPKGEHKVSIFHRLRDHAGQIIFLAIMQVKNFKRSNIQFLLFAGSRGAFGRDVWNQESFRHQYVRRAVIIVMSIINENRTRSILDQINNYGFGGFCVEFWAP